MISLQNGEDNVMNWRSNSFGPARTGATLALAIAAFGAWQVTAGSQALAATIQSEGQPKVCAAAYDVNSCELAPVRQSDSRVSLLHAGSTADEIERLLGMPSITVALGGSASDNRELIYADLPIWTRLVLTEGRVTEITLDLAYFDFRKLPFRAWAVKATMVRGAVLALLGQPSADDQWLESGLQMEQLTFKVPNEPEFSVVLADGSVVYSGLGHQRPAGIASVPLPGVVSPATSKGDLRIGMTWTQAVPLLGRAVQTVGASFKGRPVEYATYHDREGEGFVSLTFTSGVLTAFKIWPASSF